MSETNPKPTGQAPELSFTDAYLIKDLRIKELESDNRKLEYKLKTMWADSLETKTELETQLAEAKGNITHYELITSNLSSARDIYKDQLSKLQTQHATLVYAANGLVDVLDVAAGRMSIKDIGGGPGKTIKQICSDAIETFNAKVGNGSISNFEVVNSFIKATDGKDARNEENT